MVNAPVLAVVPPMGPGEANVAPLKLEAFRLATFVVLTTENGAVPIASVEVICPVASTGPVKNVPVGRNDAVIVVPLTMLTLLLGDVIGRSALLSPVMAANGCPRMVLAATDSVIERLALGDGCVVSVTSTSVEVGDAEASTGSWDSGRPEIVDMKVKLYLYKRDPIF